MSAQDRNKARADEDRARDALGHAMQVGLLPDAAQGPAQALLDRLRTPVRVAILGFPGIGRSQVLNLLAGASIVPTLNGRALPTLELVHGDAPRATLTMADGSLRTRDDIDLAAINDDAPSFVRLEADLPALKRISLLEVVAGADPRQQARAVAWVAKRADLAIWCTRDFGPAEQLVWSAASDALKADGILLRTHADLLRDTDALLRVLRHNSGDGFDQILAIDTPRAHAAREAEGGPDRKTFKAAGGQALISTVLRMVERQRALLVDQTDLLFMRHLGTTDPTTLAPPSGIAPAEAAASQIADYEIAAPPAVQAAPKVQPKPAAKPQPKAKTDAAVEASPPAKPKATAPKVEPKAGLDAATVTVLSGGVARLTKAGAEMAAEMAQDADPEAVMDRSVAELIWLSEHLDAAEADRSTATLVALRDRAIDAADLAQLMQLEDSADAATEAVSLMIQMRRTLSQELAYKPAA